MRIALFFFFICGCTERTERTSDMGACIEYKVVEEPEREVFLEHGLEHLTCPSGAVCIQNLGDTFCKDYCN